MSINILILTYLYIPNRTIETGVLMTEPKKKKVLDSFLNSHHSRLLDEASSLIEKFNQKTRRENPSQQSLIPAKRIKKTYLVQEMYHDKLKLLAALKKVEISDLVNEAFRQFLNQKSDNIE